MPVVDINKLLAILRIIQTNKNKSDGKTVKWLVKRYNNGYMKRMFGEITKEEVLNIIHILSKSGFVGVETNVGGEDRCWSWFSRRVRRLGKVVYDEINS